MKASRSAGRPKSATVSTLSSAVSRGELARDDDHRPAATVAAAAIAPITLPQSVRQRIFLYLGILIVLLAFGAPSGGLMDIPISFS